jgi:hypothetical protein
MPLLEGPTLRAYILELWAGFTDDRPAEWEQPTDSPYATPNIDPDHRAAQEHTAPAESTPLPYRDAVGLARAQLDGQLPGRDRRDAGSLPQAAVPGPVRDAPTHAPPAAGGRLRQTLQIFRSLCETLAVIHGEGLVHRDLKPENIILGLDSQPTIVDFGLIAHFGARRARESIEGEYQLAGTPGYMAPEQILQELVDARADLYALGCMLYEALTRRRPFGDARGLDLVQRQLYEAPNVPSTWARGIAPELDALVLRLLERHPQKRVGHASDAGEVLRRLLGQAPSPSALPARHYLYRPTLAGRLELLTMLEGRLSRSEDGPARMCLIGGPSGIGKTRLAVELMTSAARRRLRVFHGECLPLTSATLQPASLFESVGGDEVLLSRGVGGLRGAPLHPFRPFLRGVADICVRDGPLTTDELVGDRLPVLCAYAPELRSAPGAMRSSPGALSDEAGQRKVLQDLATTFQALADRSPFLLVIDDVQWADPLSLAFLLALAEGELELHGLMILCTYRSEQLSPALNELVSACREDAFVLEPLEREGVESMVEDMLASEEVPPPFVDYLSRASAGSPFFVAQYLRTAVEEKILRRRISGEWIVDPEVVDPDSEALDSLPLPASVEQLVLHRVGQLSHQARTILDAAAVIARDFDASAVAALADLDTERALDCLAELLEHGVLTTLGGTSFAFSHDKVRELSYRSLSPERRIELHERAARALAARVPDAEADSKDIDPALLPVLADHWLAAGDVDKGVEHLILAGRAALDAYAPASAAPFLARALTLVEDGDGTFAKLSRIQRARLERDYAWSLYCTGDVKDYLAHSHRALELLGQPTPQSTRGWAWSGLTEFARHCLFGVLPRRLLRARLPTEQARFRLGAETAASLSWGYIYGNSPPRALGLSLVAANLSHRAGAIGPRAVPYTMLGATWGSFGLGRLADRYFAEARRSSQEVEVIGQAFVQRWIEGMHHFNFARWERGRELIDEVLARGRSNGDAHAMVNSLSILSIAAYHRGELELSAQYAAEARELARANAYAVLETVTRCQLAATHLHSGKADRALPLLADRTGVDESLEGVMTLITRRAIQAGAFMMAGRHGEGIKAADSAVELLEANPAGNMTSIMAHYWLPSVYMDSLRRAREGGEASERLESRARLTIRWAKRFARMYPIGRPLLARHEANWLELRGATQASAKYFSKSARLAEALGMAEERRLAQQELTSPGVEFAPALPEKAASH